MDVLKSPYAYFLATRLRIRQVLRLLEPVAEDRVLDGGCGIGYVCALLAGKVVLLAGLDIDLDSLRAAQGYAKNDFVNADIRQIPFQDDTFTKVVLTEVLEHLAQEGEALEELKRVCRHNAEVVVTVPCTEGLLSFTPLRLLGHKEPGIEHHYRYGYTKEQLESLLTRHGFVVERTVYCTGVISEAVVQLSKAGYLLKKKRFKGQGDLAAGDTSFVFRIYKYLCFPVVYGIGLFEEAILSRFGKGHILVMRAKVKK